MKLPARNGGYLLLEDGAKFQGDLFLGNTPAFGEAVFNTSHTGYQEIITDPSYHRQLITFTAVHIGNVGVNSDDTESANQRAAGVIIKSLPTRSRSWRAESDLDDWLTEENIPMLAGADTRGITRHLRQRGAMRAGLFPDNVELDDALNRVRSSEPMIDSDLAKEVMTDTPFEFSPSPSDKQWRQPTDTGKNLRVAVLDFGVKTSILRELARRGCRVTVLPAVTDAEQIMSAGYHGLLLSNGPGDPAAVTYGIETVRQLLPTGLPLFGICLGHQILSLAAGGATFKLSFGHRGANHPVRCETDQTIEITSQNHGFAVAPEALPSDIKVTHINLNDQTIEGIRHRKYPAFSIQYHPEAGPGPHEGTACFDQFIEEMHRAKA